MSIIVPSQTIECPACSGCGQPTRIYGIEPYSGQARTDVLTYVCDACEVTEVRIAPSQAQVPLLQ
jgi:hypothetical protein